MTIYAKIKAMLAEHKADFSEKEHAAQGDGAAVAKIHGLTESQGAKAIVLSVKKVGGTVSNYLAVFPADRKIDDKAIRRFLNAQKVSFEKAEKSQEVTGCVPGSIPPFSFTAELPLIVDEELLKNDKIFFNIGTLENSITLKVSDYQKMIGQVPVFSFTKAPEARASAAPQAMFSKSEEVAELKKTEGMIDELDRKIQSLLTARNLGNGEYEKITDLLLESLVNKVASPELVKETLADAQNQSVMVEIIKLYNEITGSRKKSAEVNEMIQNIVENISVCFSMRATP